MDKIQDNKRVVHTNIKVTGWRLKLYNKWQGDEENGVKSIIS